MKKGDHVRHKLTGQTMVVKRRSGGVCSLIKDVPEPYRMMDMEYPGDVAICSVANLEKIKVLQPTPLFPL